MVSNVEVDIENFFGLQNPGLLQECEAVYQRELERERKAKEKLVKARADGKEAEPAIARVPPDQSHGTTETSGPIVLGEPVPGQSILPPVTPLRPPPITALSNGTSPEDANQQKTQNGSTGPSRPDEDTQMTDSQDLNVNTQIDFQFQTPNRVDTQGTQTQKSQASARTFIGPYSHANDYHNSASTTTSGQKTSNRSSDIKSNTQSSNGAALAGLPDFTEMLPQPGGSQIPDTQGTPHSLQYQFSLSPEHETDLDYKTEVHYVSSQPSNSDPSQSSQQQHTMPAPVAPRHTSNLGAILNDEEPKPQLLLDETQLVAFHQMLVASTSGCSLEQLEQINASLMDAIWQHRADYNRNVVLHKVQDAFNEIIADIQVMQEIMQVSMTRTQDTPEPETQYNGAQAQVRYGVPMATQGADDAYFAHTQAGR
jgi:hypothetical protein